MSAPLPLLLVGGFGSPYTRKLRAVLRYRRIPFRFILRGSKEDVGIPPVPVALIPVLVFPEQDGKPPEAAIDSTPLVRRLEAKFPERAVVPGDPALAFLDALVEDYADEWLTKAMFHYRWTYSPDIEKASQVLVLDRRLDVAGERLEDAARAIASRQIARLRVVGSNETTRPVIEESYRRLLAIADGIFAARPFVLGARPAACDFALYGQLSQLALFDPTPVRIAEETAPRVISWLSRVEDLGALEPAADGWLARSDMGDALRPLATEIGRVYAPFLLANARALETSAERVEATIDGKPWVQQPFPYQGKCLRALREARAALAPGDRAFVDGVLAGSGCEALFA
jgi:glutathione S-transferase